MSPDRLQDAVMAELLRQKHTIGRQLALLKSAIWRFRDDGNFAQAQPEARPMLIGLVTVLLQREGLTRIELLSAIEQLFVAPERCPVCKGVRLVPDVDGEGSKIYVECQCVLNLTAQNKDKQFVLLETIGLGSRFFTTNGRVDPTKGEDGETWYRVVGYADTVEEAQSKLYGKKEEKQ